MATKFERDGIEEDISRMKKVDKMRRAIEILGNVRGVAHIEMAEKELGKLFTGPVEFKESESHPYHNVNILGMDFLGQFIRVNIDQNMRVRKFILKLSKTIPKDLDKWRI